jgi:hypothetical protein
MILDVHMPGCAGLEVNEALRRREQATRMPLSASSCEQPVCAIQFRLLQRFSSAVAIPSKSPRRASVLTAFGSAPTNGLSLELCSATGQFSFLLRASVRRHEWH